MKTRPTPVLAMVWALALALVSLTGTAPAAAQGKPAPQPVAEEDLGDGLRAVWYGDNPTPVIYDDVTGMLLKGTAENPVVVDQKGGFYLHLDKEGNPQVKGFGSKGGGGEIDAKALKRARGFMKRARKLHESGRWEKGSGKTGKQKQGKKKLPTRLELVMQLLSLSAEEKAALESLLAAILAKQDQIQRSTLQLTSGKDGKVVGAKSAKISDLPAPIKSFLSASRSQLAGKGAVSPESLKAYRAARKTQTSELTALREKLREVLTQSQEAALVAVGVLD